MKITTAILEAQPFLKGMTERQLQLLAEESMLAEFKADERIIYEGGPANRFYIILEGRVGIVVDIGGGRHIDAELFGDAAVHLRDAHFQHHLTTTRHSEQVDHLLGVAGEGGG